MRWLLLITGPMLVSCGVATAQPLTDGNSSDLQQIGDNNDIDVKQASADAAANRWRSSDWKQSSDLSGTGRHGNKQEQRNCSSNVDSNHAILQ